MCGGVSGEELWEMKEARWRLGLVDGLKAADKTEEDLERERAPWKLDLAVRWYRIGAPCAWTAKR